MSNSNKATVAIVIPFFGKWPDYFPIYLKGCQFNPAINVIFITDCPEPESYPANVSFIRSSLKELSGRIRAKLNIDITDVQHAYKLCDFRPAYGVIFSDLLEKYTFWGYGDIDLIYGRLEQFVDPLIKEGYDSISFRSEIQSGSLSLFRNTDTVNHLYLKSKTHLKSFTSRNYVGFDESHGCDITWKGRSKLELSKEPMESFTYLIAKGDHDRVIKAYFGTMNEESIQPNEVVHFCKGRIDFVSRKEVAYYHYVCNKNDSRFLFPRWKEVPDQFYITNTGFYTLNQFKYKTFLHFFRSARGLAKYYTNRALQRLADKIKAKNIPKAVQ